MYWLPSLPPSQSRPLVSWITCAEGEVKACERAAVAGSINLPQLGQAKPHQPGTPWFAVPVTLGTVLELQQSSSSNCWIQVMGRGCQQRQLWCLTVPPGLQEAPPPAAVPWEGYIYPCPQPVHAGDPAQTLPPPQQLGWEVPTWPPAQ